MRDSARTNFHAGEAAIQNRLGVKDKMARISQHVVRGFMPQEHRTFFCSLPFAVMGVVDKHGHPQATLTAGNHGIITSPDDRTLAFQAHPFLANELGLDFTENQKVGMLGIELSTRRRNRMNGVLGSVANDRFAIHIEHSFGNCPQYIQTRDINPVAIQSNTVTDGGKISRGAGLSNYALNIIQTADTFFIASRSDVFNSDPRTGIDVSHRGGIPGFVAVSDSGSLVFPDFSGNRFFNTLGNITLDSRVGLLFIDFESRDMLFVRGSAKIHWDEAMIRKVNGAERIVEIAVEEVDLGKDMFPYKMQFLSYSPVLERTGAWMSV